MIKNAERQIDLQTTRAVQQLRQEAVDLSVMIASKILERNISKEDNEKLIADALRQIESASRSN
jgi:F-type H+-transporting ATPase subunit b